ncbi:DUF3084 domain-containing protein [Nodularia harveyana UHCC-0300]|uniref:DUF3084 domain-containing protein n=1 Tax=Nodularia harveyana UHCC-0300 TaxID=2974287 RepID=A0ABU5UIJ5_9CYAN|nr:DUF3084 domain-containing protein [Nodularia harveyana]MEA5582816.1 DUF3084 domain-containing protein [Nodularia harveyana UHCC-0300]
MTTGYILIAAILILGGVIATVGDRIGTRVGKARLSLFNLRPKKTAVLVTIFTGGLISASTLGILFTADEGLRQGVFELEDIQKDLRNNREQLQIAETEKSQVEKELNTARLEQTKAEEELQVINKSLQAANAKQQATATQLRRTQSQLGAVVNQYQQALTELQSVYDQRETLQAAIEELKAERERLYTEAKTAIEEAKTAIDQRDRKIAELDGLIKQRNQEITAREEVIAVRESRLKDLEKRQNYLEEEVARLEKYYQSYRDLRLGKLALVRNQILAANVVRVNQASAARQVVIELLKAANQNANIQLTEPGETPSNKQLLRVTEDRIEKLSEQIQDGQDYVVRIFSAGNYVRGENQIEFFADAARNQLVFSEGEILATTNANPKIMSSYQLSQRLDLLISASEFRARNAGIIEGVLREGSHLRFFLQLRQYDQPLEIKAIAMEDTYTAGPVRIKLLAIIDGKVIFST